MYVADDSRLSDRLRRFLAGQSRRTAHMEESRIRSTASVHVGSRQEPAPEELVAAMVWFEERYGGLFYPVMGSNGMEHGLNGDATGYHSPLGLAFAGVLDGDLTWGLDVLTDGRTAMGPGNWPHRVIDRSMDQRLEKHALLVAVRSWPHRTFTCFTPTGILPVVNSTLLPPPVPETTGPADIWWSDDSTAVQITLSHWPPGQDRWTVRYFARKPQQAAEANPTVYAALEWYETIPADWCALCHEFLPPGLTCTPATKYR
ncbi:hypothetical protein [Micromonospora ureilytica]|uniref:hypothetical protein n=1 Tax=Micromonospora ureilytica TaxID=709868 RepID=UPI000F5E1CD9|nr:hypothetical protein [Micromonospora ureilytica]